MDTQVKLMGGEVEPRRVSARLMEGQRHCGYMAEGVLGANAPQYNRRLSILTAIRKEYLGVFPDEAPFVNAGIDQVPVNWVNSRLKELGETWRVAMGEGGYKLPPLAAP